MRLERGLQHAAKEQLLADTRHRGHEREDCDGTAGEHRCDALLD